MFISKAIVLTATILFAAASSVFSAEPGRETLPGHVPAVVAGQTPKSHLPATNQPSFAIGLPLRNPPANAPWAGTRAVRETNAVVMARARFDDLPSHQHPLHVKIHHHGPRGDTVEFPLRVSTNDLGSAASPASPRTSQPGPFGTNGTPLAFTGATLADTSAFPPDSMGAIGPAQFIVAVNGRLRTLDKNTGLPDGVLNASMDTFFNSVMTPPAANNFTSDPHIRFDRLTGRWFLIIIDVPGSSGALPNRVLLAVSDTNVITAGTVWSFFQFQHDLVSPAGDTGNFADYPTLGIDANALYIGDNLFTAAGAFAGCSGFVVRKSSVLGAGPVVVTAFRGLVPSASGAGPYTPQGVDNYDPAATEGYFIGVDNSAFGRLVIRRVSTPAGTPTISGNLNVTVSSTAFSITVPHLGNTGGTSGNLDGLDDRLFAAHLRNGRLWTAHSIQVRSTGVASATGGRNACRWYELQNLTGTPSLVQSGTVYDSAGSNPKSYWMPTIMVSGQGHAVLGCSSAGATSYANAAVTGRLAGDALNTMVAPVNYTASSTAYNPPGDPGGSAGRRWGDYSYTSLDPSDDMTFWTIQEHCHAANSYAVQIAKIAAPPPAQLVSCSPSTTTQGVANVSVTLLGSSASGSGFFDPGVGFANRLAATVNGGGIAVNSATYNNPTNLTLNLTIATNATAGARTVTVTNPDGQSATSVSGILTIIASSLPPAITSSSLTNRTLECGSNISYTVTTSGTAPLSIQWSLDGSPVSGATNSSLALTNVHLPNHAVSVTVTNLYGSFTSNATLTVQDTLAPAVTLNGAGLMTNELGAGFTDPGATASDTCAGVLPVTTNGVVNVNVVGTNTLTYKAGDGNGNTNAVSRTVIVRDTTPPTILWSFTNLVFAANSNCLALMTNVTGTNFILATDLSGALTLTQSPTNNAALPLGTNVVVITVADASANKAFSTNRIVVRDQTPPLLALNGNNPLTNELGAAFTDPGVTASDACSGIVTVTTNGTVNVGVTGTNALTYTATDGHGNTNAATRTVVVRDTTPPVISWSFTNLVFAANSNCLALMTNVTGTNFILATDLSGALTITQSPTNNASLPLGTNVVVITVADASANKSFSTNRIVVRDQTPPLLALNGSTPLTNELGAAFTDPGVTSSDGCSGIVTVTTNGTVNVGVTGTNTLTYTATDASGNTNAVTRNVIVRDTTPPVISWSFTNFVLVADTNCSAVMPDVTGTNFILATDLSGALTLTQSPTNNAILPLGTNLVVITVKDASGNTAFSTNRIFVVDQTPPAITLNGGSSLFSELGQAFADPGATANDFCAGAVAVVASGSVNTNAVGTNTLTYTATDGNGNTNSATRIVIVRDTTPPAILWSFTNLVLAADTNCSAAMPDVTGTNFILATDLSGPLTISQTPTNGTVLLIGTNVVVVAVSDIFSNTAFSTNTIVVQDQTPPVISSQPQSQTNLAGTTANFSAAATACTPLAYQWFFNSAVLTSQTNSTLTLVSVSPTNVGNYSLVLTASGGSTTSAVATLTVNLFSTAVTLASSENPSGFNDAVNFTAVVTPTNLAGSIQFFTNGAVFDLAALVAGQAVSTGLATLPRGTNLITAIYSGDANDLPATNLLLQIVTNHPPVAASAVYTNTPGFNLSIALAGLATNWNDVDGDAVSLAGVGVSTNGITLTNTGTALDYFNSNNVADLFICTISDGFGGTNFQTVTIVHYTPPDPTPLIASVVVNADGSFTLNLGGASGYTYILEATTNLSPAVNWQPVATNVTGTNGVWQFNDTSATNFPQQFYRLKLVP